MLNYKKDGTKYWCNVTIFPVRNDQKQVVNYIALEQENACMKHACSKHDQVACPRCGTVYECKIGSINLCQCTAVHLTEEQRQYIGSLFNDCLCANCLIALQTGYNQLVQHQLDIKV